MVDHTRPVMLGYFLEAFLMTPTERARVKEQLIEFAVRQRYAVRAIFVEGLDTRPVAINALIEMVRRDNLTAVVVPRADDLDRRDRRRLADVGAHVVVARSSPDLTGPGSSLSPPAAPSTAGEPDLVTPESSASRVPNSPREPSRN